MLNNCKVCTRYASRKHFWSWKCLMVMNLDTMECVFVIQNSNGVSIRNWRNSSRFCTSCLLRLRQSHTRCALNFDVSAHVLLQRWQDRTQTNTSKYIGVSRDEYKLHVITMPTDDIINCYKISVTQISDRAPAKKTFSCHHAKKIYQIWPYTSRDYFLQQRLLAFLVPCYQCFVFRRTKLGFNGTRTV